MSKETKERGERKRADIRRIIWDIIKTCVAENMKADAMAVILNKHFTVMRIKNPQESCLVDSVAIEVSRDPYGFAERMRKIDQLHRAETKKEVAVDKI